MWYQGTFDIHYAFHHHYELSTERSTKYFPRPSPSIHSYMFIFLIMYSSLTWLLSPTPRHIWLSLGFPITYFISIKRSTICFNWLSALKHKSLSIPYLLKLCWYFQELKLKYQFVQSKRGNLNTKANSLLHKLHYDLQRNKKRIGQTLASFFFSYFSNSFSSFFSLLLFPFPIILTLTLFLSLSLSLRWTRNTVKWWRRSCRQWGSSRPPPCFASASRPVTSRRAGSSSPAAPPSASCTSRTQTWSSPSRARQRRPHRNSTGRVCRIWVCVRVSDVENEYEE